MVGQRRPGVVSRQAEKIASPDRQVSGTLTPDPSPSLGAGSSGTAMPGGTAPVKSNG